MSESDIVEARRQAQQAHQRLDGHEESLDSHDRRISTNENWRLQAQGALKFGSVALGTIGVGTFLELFVL